MQGGRGYLRSWLFFAASGLAAAVSCAPFLGWGVAGHGPLTHQTDLSIYSGHRAAVYRIVQSVCVQEDLDLLPPPLFHAYQRPLPRLSLTSRMCSTHACAEYSEGTVVLSGREDQPCSDRFGTVLLSHR